MAETPVNEPSLISARDGFPMAAIRVLSGSFTVRFWPSRAFIDSVLPSTLVISPRTRTGCASCAQTADVVTMNASPAAPSARRVIFCMVRSSLNQRAALSRPYFRSLDPAIEPHGRGTIPLFGSQDGCRTRRDQWRFSGLPAIPTHGATEFAGQRTPPRGSARRGHASAATKCAPFLRDAPGPACAGDAKDAATPTE